MLTRLPVLWCLLIRSSIFRCLLFFGFNNARVVASVLPDPFLLRRGCLRTCGISNPASSYKNLLTCLGEFQLMPPEISSNCSSMSSSCLLSSLDSVLAKSLSKNIPFISISATTGQKTFLVYATFNVPELRRAST